MIINHLNKNIALVVSDVAELANYLWQKGWAERNAGNISVNIHELVTDDIKNILQYDAFPSFGLVRPCPALEGFFFLVTGTGKRMRDIASDPEHNALMIRIRKGGTGYYIISGNTREMDFRPTSELPTHLAIHEQMVISGSRERAVVHTHPNELISLTQIPAFCDESKLNSLLWGMHPETMVVVPDGAGFIPYLLPGSQEIADRTVEKFKSHKIIIWEKHGCFAVGRDVFEAFDMIDTLAKSAQIYFQCKSAGHEPEGLSEEKIAELKELSKKFLGY
jgi:rhamnulose-1-phosphate aldolase